jgi:hypothetical protein
MNNATAPASPSYRSTTSAAFFLGVNFMVLLLRHLSLNQVNSAKIP